jgi:putative spermidine/putrescine transport system ATP-binding protein
MPFWTSSIPSFSAEASGLWLGAESATYRATGCSPLTKNVVAGEIGAGDDVALALEGITKCFGRTVAVFDLSLSVREGELVSLLGPSGCGKTTILRCIAGYIRPDAGAIHLFAENVTSKPPFRRGIGMVFQNYALFPHMTVERNVAFGLRMRKMTRQERRQRVEETLSLVHLEGFERRWPADLSGGQQQRVALARAIAIRPHLLLLDEPLSNLDAKLRRSMQIEIRTLQETLRITTVLVTHDQAEALSLSDRVVVMNEGQIQQVGTPADIYARPKSAFVADFIGESNLLGGRVKSFGSRAAKATFELETGEMLEIEGARDLSGLVGKPITVLARPESVQVCVGDAVEPLSNMFDAVVKRLVYQGASDTILLELDSGLILSAERYRSDTHAVLGTGQSARVHLPPKSLLFLSN